MCRVHCTCVAADRAFNAFELLPEPGNQTLIAFHDGTLLRTSVSAFHLKTYTLENM